mmetsp:Transcript_26818/g.51094  ORF Transcript_26818/g.51094 Transcript_26818/m.51094 type:complete len:102 (+) Transcript_26818:1304-1609(+)|eukprot:CAMPEP_0114226094 /NCGR_PEP_ID=MMETSP0058-20121206/1048_1 /TAXON_ID=36894 /ORGANISM="Pyramimonas parkeae, CCMP726" /LENGTH=101 /DNA_ID=CAMNT_0001336795 /DNA_START=2067 /DNA_END=2372 /DNA_ORIENTATION=+
MEPASIFNFLHTCLQAEQGERREDSQSDADTDLVNYTTCSLMPRCSVPASTAPTASSEKRSDSEDIDRSSSSPEYCTSPPTQHPESDIQVDPENEHAVCMC